MKYQILILALVGLQFGCADKVDKLKQEKNPAKIEGQSAAFSYDIHVMQNGDKKIFHFIQEFQRMEGSKFTTFSVQNRSSADPIVIRADVEKFYPDQATLLEQGIDITWAPLEILYRSCHVSLQQRNRWAAVIFDICEGTIHSVVTDYASELDEKPVFDPAQHFVARAIHLDEKDELLKIKSGKMWRLYRHNLNQFIARVDNREYSEIEENLPVIWKKAMEDVEAGK